MLFIEETDYLISLIRADVLALQKEVQTWQTTSINQKAYDSKVADDLMPKLALIEATTGKLSYTASNIGQLSTIQHTIGKLAAAATYQLTSEQLNAAVAHYWQTPPKK